MVPARQHIFRTAGLHRPGLLAGLDVVEITGRIQAEQKRAGAEMVEPELVAERADGFDGVAWTRRQPVQLAQDTAEFSRNTQKSWDAMPRML
jgi:hypothetical protein